MKRNKCAIVLEFQRGNTKGIIFNANRKLLFAEAEEPKLATDQICDYLHGRGLKVGSVSIKVARKSMARAAGYALARITRAL